MEMTTADMSALTSIGAQDAAQKTYASVKKAVANHPKLSTRNVDVFLQGSYPNSTNITGDSDVDIVVMSKRTFYHDLTRLDASAKKAFHEKYGPSTYTHEELRADVTEALVEYYGKDRITPHKKCLRVEKSNGYVDADVVPAFEHRLYKSFHPIWGDYIQGTRIFPTTGGSIVNYPKEHIGNGRQKNKLANDNYKPTVRQLKSLKKRAVSMGLIDAKSAPGYLLECMVYNVPNTLFDSHDYKRLAYVFNWLLDADFNQFVSADEVHTLFSTDPGKFSASEAQSTVATLARQVSWA